MVCYLSNGLWTIDFFPTALQIIVFLLYLNLPLLSGEHCGKFAANSFQHTFTMQMSLPKTCRKL